MKQQKLSASCDTFSRGCSTCLWLSHTCKCTVRCTCGNIDALVCTETMVIKFGKQLRGMYRRYLSKCDSFLSFLSQSTSNDVSSRSVLVRMPLRLTEWTFVKRLQMQVLRVTTRLSLVYQSNWVHPTTLDSTQNSVPVGVFLTIIRRHLFNIF